MLLLDAGKTLEVDTLIDLLWDDHDQPRDPRATLHVNVSRLRRRLADAGAATYGVQVDSVGSSYIIRAGTATIDVQRFACRVHEAQLLTDPVDRRQAVTDALGLWRGDALAGLLSPEQRVRMCAELDELRISAVELGVAADLELGKYDTLIPELTGLTLRHPTRERLLGALMIALYLSGRQREALATYDRAADLLAAELGLDPGTALRDLRLGILRQDPALTREWLAATTQSVSPVRLAGTAGTAPNPSTRLLPDQPGRPELGSTAPSMLPPATFGFVGRAPELGYLDALAGDPTGARIAALAGSAGVGKTALVTHWAHKSRALFPDGQLYVNLRGYSGTAPVTSLQALRILLEGLGVRPAQVPVDVDGAAALFRTLTADRHVLVILDNALDVAQVRPLLPAGTHCFTVVTSRTTLGGLTAREGARGITVPILPRAESLQLLRSLLGDRGGPIDELAAMCAHLPLAIRIAAANITERLGWTVDGYLDTLRRGDRLSALQVADDPETAVRAAFDLTYQALDPAARHLLRLIGEASGPDLSWLAVQALARSTVPAATTALQTLLRHHLVDDLGRGRYTMHDLLRLYAAQQAASTDPEGERTAAAERLLRYYLERTAAAAAAAYPHAARAPLHEHSPIPTEPASTFPDGTAAIGWLEDERANLVSIVVQPPFGLGEYAWRLADQLRGFLALRRYDDDWLRTAQAARNTALHENIDLGRAASELSLGWAYRCTGRYDQALPHLTAARDASQRANWPHGHATALSYLGITHADAGRPTTGIAFALQAHHVAEQLPPAAEALTLNNAGVIHLLLGELQAAENEFGRAQRLIQDAGSASAFSIFQVNQGFARLLLGQYPQARTDLIRGLRLCRQIGDRVGEALSTASLARLHLHCRNVPAARHLAPRALNLARSIGDDFSTAYALTINAETLRASGNPAHALDRATEALHLARTIANLQYEIEALLSMGRAALDTGRRDRAHAWLTEALQIAQRSEHHCCAGKALTALAQLHAHHDNAAAVEHACRALTIHQTTGYRAGQLETEALLRLITDTRP